MDAIRFDADSLADALVGEFYPELAGREERTLVVDQLASRIPELVCSRFIASLDQEHLALLASLSEADDHRLPVVVERLGWATAVAQVVDELRRELARATPGQVGVISNVGRRSRAGTRSTG